MNIFSIFLMFGGLALFLAGMHFMGVNLSKLSGGRLEYILGKLTASPLRAVLLGAGVTAVIQSSSATTVMVVGFVNSGIMTLHQGKEEKFRRNSAGICGFDDRYGSDERCGGAPERDTGLYQSVSDVFQSGDGNDHGSAADSGDPEFLRLSRYFAGALRHRSGALCFRNSHHNGAEYRDLCDGAAVCFPQRCQCKAGRMYSSVF